MCISIPWVFLGLSCGVYTRVKLDDSTIIKAANTVETKQRDSLLGYEDMNTHEQAGSPGKTTGK